MRTKNRAIGHVPMDTEVCQALQRCRLMAPTASVFRLEAFKHLAQRLRKLAKVVGVKPIRFHDLRHTFGSQLAMERVELSARQTLMRHKTTAMTNRYTHFAPDYLRSEIEKLARKGGTQESAESGKAKEA